MRPRCHDLRVPSYTNPSRNPPGLTAPIVTMIPATRTAAGTASSRGLSRIRYVYCFPAVFNHNRS